MKALIQLSPIDPEIAVLMCGEATYVVCTSPHSLEKLELPAGAHLVCGGGSRECLAVPPLLGRFDPPERVISSEDVWETVHRTTGVTLYPRTTAVALGARLGATEIHIGGEGEWSVCEEEVLESVRKALAGVQITRG